MASVDTHGRRLTGLEHDVPEREHRTLAADARVALRRDDDAGATDSHRAAHVLLDRDLRIEQRVPTRERRGGPPGRVAKTPERPEHHPRSPRAELIGPAEPRAAHVSP